jgi:hypothetical protein
VDGQWVAVVLLADPAVLRNGLAVRHRPQRMDYMQHSTLLHKAVLHSASKKEIGQQDVMSPKFWAAQQQVRVDEQHISSRTVAVGYELLLRDPVTRQSFGTACVLGDDGLPAWPYIVEGKHQDPYVAAELAALAAIAALASLDGAYNYQEYLASAEEQDMAVSVHNSREALLEVWNDLHTAEV